MKIRSLVAISCLLSNFAFAEATLRSELRPSETGNVSSIGLVSNGGPDRLLKDRGAAIINVRDLRAATCAGNYSVDTAAMQDAIAIAKRWPGSTIYLPACSWSFIGSGPGNIFAIPSRTKVVGDGPSNTVLTWKDDEGVNLFGADSTSSARAQDIEFADFSIRGTWDARGNTSNGGHPLIPAFVDGLTFRNLKSEYSRAMGIVARNAISVRSYGNIIRYAGRDGINFSQCANVDIVGNIIEHVDDDAIAVHSDTTEPWGVRRNINISSNRIFDAQGIKALSARHASITGNVLDVVRSQGIHVGTEPIVGSSFQEGASAALAISITGNSITNLINRKNIDNLNQGAPGIVINGKSARTGSYAAIPGEPNTVRATVVDPYPEILANSPSTMLPTPGSFGIVVSGNIVARTLPPSNTTRFPNWTSLNFGMMFTRNGWVNPSLAEDDMRDSGIVIGGGVVRDVQITENIIRGMSAGLEIRQAVRLDNIVFRGNQVIDSYSYGAIINTTGMLRIMIEDNIFDLDPFIKHNTRGSNGTWTTIAGPTGLFVNSGSGLYVRRNTFRNMARDYNFDNSNPPAGTYFEGNIVEADASVFGAFSTLNKGVGQVITGSGTRYARTISDPGSDTFGAITKMPSATSIYQPPADPNFSYAIGSGGNLSKGSTAGGGTNGIHNFALGSGVLAVNTTGGLNIGVGGNALAKNTTGTGQVAIGFEAGAKLTSGGYNTAIGTGALTSANGSYFNVGVGANACASVTSGRSNICIGKDGNITTGSNNIVIGISSTATKTGDSNQLTIGDTITGNLATSGNNGAVAIKGTLAPLAGLRLPATSVASLPTCNAAQQDMLYVVFDASAPVYRGLVKGGGSTRTPVYCDGLNWMFY